MNWLQHTVAAFGLERHLSYWMSGGVLLIPIALVSVGIWLYFVRTRRLLVGMARESGRLIPAISGLDDDAGAAGILNILGAKQGAMALILRTIMRDVKGGSTLTDAFVNRQTQGMNLLRRDIVVLSALTAIAPLLGLLGTVIGMTDTFDAVSRIGGDTGSRVASGISQALITTQFGLIVALPGIFGTAYLRKLLRRVENHLDECRAHVVTLLEQRKRTVPS